MTRETEHKLAQLRKYSTGLRMFFNFLAFVFAIGGVATLLVVATRGGSVEAGIGVWGSEFSGDQVTWTLKILVAIWVVIVFGVALKLVRHLAALFDLYSQGRIFTADDVRQIRQIGISVFLLCLSSVYAMLARILLIAIDHPLPPAAGGFQQIGPGIDTSIGQVVAGIIIIVISWIMDVGRELREDAELTV